MFDIGFWEISLIMLLALLIVGPERLPGLVSTLGGWAGRARFMARSLRMQVERELAKEVADKKQASSSTEPAARPKAERTPVQQAAEDAQAAEEAALAAAGARQQEVQDAVESQADDRSRPD